MTAQQPTPANSYALYSNRPVRGIGLHHTATNFLPAPRLGSSWHHIIDRDPNATIYSAVPLNGAAHTILAANKWRPPWMLRSPDGRTSDPNYCMLNIEIVYLPTAPSSSPSNSPTPAQMSSLRSLLNYYYSLYGALPIVGHGELQSDKWPTEPNPWPTLFSTQLPLTPKNKHGRFFIPSQPPPTEDTVIDISDEDLKAYFEQLGTPVNMSTGIMQRAALAYRRGETRGPAISGEYIYENKPRQRFTAGTAEYQPDTGGVNWVELNTNPES